MYFDQDPDRSPQQKPSEGFWASLTGTCLITVAGVLAMLGFSLFVIVRSVLSFDEDEDEWGNIRTLAFAADGRTLVGDEFVYLAKTVQTELYGWDRATGEPLWKAILPGFDSITTLMPDGQTLVTLCDLKANNARRPPDSAAPKAYVLQFRQAQTGRLLGQSAPLATREVSASLDISPSGRRAAVLLDGGVRIWEAAGDQGKDRLVPGRWRSVLPASAVKRVGYLKHAQFALGERCLLVKTESSARLWDIRSGKRVRSFDDASEVILSPDRRQVATLKEGTSKKPVSVLRLVDLATGHVVSEFRGSGWPTDSTQAADKLRFLPANILGLEGNTVAVTLLTDLALLQGSSEDVAIVRQRRAWMDLCWNVASNQVRRTTLAPYSPLDALAFSTDGRYAAGAFSDYDDKLGYIRNLSTGEETILKGHRFR